ncbi:hypothetical protein SAMN04515674_102413 [Pseudarcicella hirudinis]|uniref:Outer membrane lipoprotein-sorting protein n=2 Tax=Pseudarcicella hirudinis TaxID=1079859 RepID=A0A1I5PCS8_9BACT|nr:hypothetical protein [Pseudarcicella hirudinis]SFP31918.1 hypothetical protein SAMN04515674_102413 [Pseudarcicella hirudinis]
MKVTKFFASAAVAVLLSVSAFAQTVDEVVAKHIEAMGGIDKWKSIKGVEMNNSMSMQGMDISMKSVVIPGKAMKSTVKVMGQEIITVINGETGWSIRPAMMGGTGEAEDLPKDQLKMTRGQMDLGGLLVNYKEKGSTLELAGKEKMDGGDVYKLKLTDKAGEVTNIFVSASTYYILKTAGKRTINGQDIDTEVNYSNFKQVEGLTFPFTMETASPMGGQITIETESIKLNPTIDEAIFQRPAKK